MQLEISLEGAHCHWGTSAPACVAQSFQLLTAATRTHSEEESRFQQQAVICLR